MNWLANVMVCVNARDVPHVAALSTWLGEAGYGRLSDTTGPDTRWGGSEYPSCTVWAGTLTNGSLGEVLDQVRATPWLEPHAVQVLLMESGQYFFRLWMFRDGELRQFAPETPTERDDDFWTEPLL
ncbi:squamosa promoter-binding protein 15 [Amycolatopsis suaedae]|uniref:Squamosa promoter-binding protein 15 n=1 Tax=Amycolatopsis suaedae TaxID=2510978 RepID=A0A4Q7J458_9PSEU|nr:squamosa promoter-binding protein 15 [Amycolatopsis suaedae]RZQ61777.1 squamosa promoter-binding protein 15 [Amycolatopsis suaedae]